MTENQSQKANTNLTESKNGEESPNRPTIYKESNRPLTAKVTKITDRGFLLRVSGTDYYFMSFERFPWFRYLNDADIKLVRVYYGDPDCFGEFTIEWPMIGLSLGTNQIAWHSQHPFMPRALYPIEYPSCEGKLSDRRYDFSDCQKHEVEATFTFKGKFVIGTDTIEQARWVVENQCKMTCRAVEVAVHIPFFEITWDFPFRVEAVTTTSADKQESEKE